MTKEQEAIFFYQACAADGCPALKNGRCSTHSTTSCNRYVLTADPERYILEAKIMGLPGLGKMLEDEYKQSLEVKVV